jgi:rod shape-determining protein MreD
MRSVLVGLPILGLAAILQSTVLPGLALLNGRIDLVLLLAISWTLAGDWQGGALWGFIGGIWLDLLSGGPMGVSSFILVAMTFLASLSEGRVWRSNIILPLGTALVTSLLYHLSRAVATMVWGLAVDWESLFRSTILPALLLNALLVVPVYTGLRWLYGLVQPRLIE